MFYKDFIAAVALLLSEIHITCSVSKGVY